jgi:hypothetical protein
MSKNVMSKVLQRSSFLSCRIARPKQRCDDTRWRQREVRTDVSGECGGNVSVVMSQKFHDCIKSDVNSTELLLVVISKKCSS